uniref:HPP family protein n=1 Tax=Candidatus Kentrum sp. MB TaxID=2138164 RepID=A0A450XGT7_9GAMM|nr:MAG: HPP family protein [Candidatus Kentron sp. MB]VFK28398.1 MAG: HPP family protein [Candidatus Kentron sp. MB]VFK74236.1 MAG: HPP family protein [Candidatus Kentron sp. MB]
MTRQSSSSPLANFTRFLGIQANPTGHGERFLSALGGGLSILVVVFITRYFAPSDGAVFLVASMGASAVLLFSAPQGPFSQPWPLLVGHLIASAIGVTSAMMLSDPLFAASVAVLATIMAMHYLRCTHPPGAATALTAVVGGPAIHDLGYWFLLVPVGVNVVIMLCMAVLLHYGFPGRRYPASLNH